MWKIVILLLIGIIDLSVLDAVCVDQIPASFCAFSKKYQNNFCKTAEGFKNCRYSCDMCTSTAPTTPQPTNAPTIDSSTCGRSSVPQSRIINGVTATPGAWPWIASLQKYGGHFCGATILSPKWVITASHCVENIKTELLKYYSIVVGAHNHQDTKDNNVKRHAIKRIVMHPYYTQKTLIADLAMIELSTPIQFNSRVKTACLPSRGIYPQIGTECYLAGWGSITHPGSSHHILQQVKLPVTPGSYCKHQQEVVCVGKGATPQANGEQQPNACRGDSGGPLVCQQPDGRWQLEGVASYVYTYCKYYTGYSPVNKYYDWIVSFLRQ